MILKKIFKLFIASLLSLLILGFFGVISYRMFFSPVLKNRIDFILGRPIAYSPGSFDDRFGISREDFLVAAEQASEIWNRAAGRKILEYRYDGDLKINLIYDERQRTSDELRSLNDQVTSEETVFSNHKKSYEAAVKEYQTRKAALEALIQDYNQKKEFYESELGSMGKLRSNKIRLDDLQRQSQDLAASFNQMKEQESALHSLVDEINSYARRANESLPELNSDIQQFNDLASSSSQEFQEGEYLTDASYQEINVYQFDNKTALISLLAHEFGHALGLDHSDNSEALMYKLNYSQSSKLSPDDLQALKWLDIFKR